VYVNNVMQLIQGNSNIAVGIHY